MCLATSLLLTACEATPSGIDATKLAPARPETPPLYLQAGSDTELRQQISDAVAAAWRRSDYHWLDSTADEYIRTRAKTYSGKWRLSVFYSALSDALSIDWPVDWYSNGTACRCKIPEPTRYVEANRRWNEVREKVDEWVKQAPQSAHAKLALAQLLVNRAWFYRGTAYAESVPVEAWPLVSRYLEEARYVLSTFQAVRSSDPEWFDIMFFVASAQSWPRAQLDTLVQELHKSGQSYTTAYQSAASTFLPKWGGTYEALERFARQAKADSGEEGAELYTRIYWNSVSADRFHEAQADWPTMKSGFESIISKYPDPRNWNGMAMYACAAGDATAFKEAINRLGGELTPDTWSISVERCKAQYGMTLP
jgi:hypothetical protein